MTYPLCSLHRRPPLQERHCHKKSFELRSMYLAKGLCSDCSAIPSAAGRAFRRSEVRNLVRSLKLQLFCTLLGLVESGTCSVLGDWRTLAVDTGDDALLRIAWVERELFILMRSRNPIFPLPGNLQHYIFKFHFTNQAINRIITINRFFNSQLCYN